MKNSCQSKLILFLLNLSSFVSFSLVSHAAAISREKDESVIKNHLSTLFNFRRRKNDRFQSDAEKKKILDGVKLFMKGDIKINRNNFVHQMGKEPMKPKPESLIESKDGALLRCFKWAYQRCKRDFSKDEEVEISLVFFFGYSKRKEIKSVLDGAKILNGVKKFLDEDIEINKENFEREIGFLPSKSDSAGLREGQDGLLLYALRWIRDEWGNAHVPSYSVSPEEQRGQDHSTDYKEATCKVPREDQKESAPSTSTDIVEKEDPEEKEEREDSHSASFVSSEDLPIVQATTQKKKCS